MRTKFIVAGLMVSGVAGLTAASMGGSSTEVVENIVVALHPITLVPKIGRAHV